MFIQQSGKFALDIKIADTKLPDRQVAQTSPGISRHAITEARSIESSIDDNTSGRSTAIPRTRSTRAFAPAFKSEFTKLYNMLRDRKRRFCLLALNDGGSRRRRRRSSTVAIDDLSWPPRSC
ncbi:hypothetical protein [Solimonas terrae]|uniref:Uncharacterized protein n=1 Tax=Solimonas terrae TaxID=1396819 RepID=A0A6M2BTG1_9GAMM|nr:hypothetical protein [Solimonas terrae]NGY05620.1 hypothetical protein [Solimonas terrae]